MEANRTLAAGIAGFASGYLAARVSARSNSGKAVVCYITDLKPSMLTYQVKEDDVIEWLEKPVPGKAKQGFNLHFEAPSPVGKIVYSENFTRARARVGLLTAGASGAADFRYFITPVGQDKGDQDPVRICRVVSCPHCPP